MKKFVSVFLVAVVLVSALCVNVFAAEPMLESLIREVENGSEAYVSIKAAGAAGMSASDNIYVKGDKACYEYETGPFKFRAVFKDGKTYLVMPLFGVYTVVDGYSINDPQSLLKTAFAATLGVTQYVGSTTETLNGVTYVYEEYNDRAAVTIVATFADGELVKITVTDTESGSVQVTNFNAVTTSVDDSVFETDSYKDITAYLSWLMVLVFNML